MANTKTFKIGDRVSFRMGRKEISGEVVALPTSGTVKVSYVTTTSRGHIVHGAGIFSRFEVEYIRPIHTPIITNTEA